MDDLKFLQFVFERIQINSNWCKEDIALGYDSTAYYSAKCAAQWAHTAERIINNISKRGY